MGQHRVRAPRRHARTPRGVPRRRSRLLGFIDRPVNAGATGVTSGLTHCRWDVRRTEVQRALLRIEDLLGSLVAPVNGFMEA